MYSVYWIKLESHTSIFTEGYVGITTNLKERLRAHKKNKRYSPFTCAIKKHGWNNLIVEVLHEGCSLQEALSIEKSYRPTIRLGWNCQAGGELGVEPSWYNNEENRQKHKEATSVRTKEAIAVKDSTEARSERAKQNWIEKAESYKGVVLGSKNPRALLNEYQVWEIKYVLIPSGIHTKEIAEMFLVKPHVIQFIKSGKNWSHI